MPGPCNECTKSSFVLKPPSPHPPSIAPRPAPPHYPLHKSTILDSIYIILKRRQLLTFKVLTLCSPSILGIVYIMEMQMQPDAVCPNSSVVSSPLCPRCPSVETHSVRHPILVCVSVLSSVMEWLSVLVSVLLCISSPPTPESSRASWGVPMSSCPLCSYIHHPRYSARTPMIL